MARTIWGCAARWTVCGSDARRWSNIVASALEEGNLALAQIAALHLRLPDLPDLAARDRIEAEDTRLESGDVLIRSFDPAQHPRAGVPPNPGWFAPTGGLTTDGPAARPAAIQIAANEEERAPEELLDPVGPVRQAVWEARITLLRRIDPANPSLTYFANPKSPPSQAALDRLDTAIEAATIKRVTDKVMPSGVPIGKRGSGPDIRELPVGPTPLDVYLTICVSEELRTGRRLMVQWSSFLVNPVL